MAINPLAVVHVAGLAEIWVGGYFFGYTQNGANMTFEGHTINVPGDENGGDEGPPVEIQMLGETARVRLEMTKWDGTVANTIASRAPGGTPGAAKTPGRLIFANADYMRLTIKPVDPITGVVNTADVKNFPCAVVARTPIEMNAGTKYSRFICEFECFKAPVAGNGATVGVLYNTATA